MLSKRLFIYDFLRLLAMLVVVLAHILHAEVSWGFIGIGIFLIMSGYLLASGEKSLSINSMLPYFRRRFIRIYPLYWIGLILFVCVTYLLAN
jgi:peptidoglycan/LPS O-acetylase OafA/YrhL